MVIFYSLFGIIYEHHLPKLVYSMTYGTVINVWKEDSIPRMVQGDVDFRRKYIKNLFSLLNLRRILFSHFLCFPLFYIYIYI